MIKKHLQGEIGMQGNEETEGRNNQNEGVMEKPQGNM